LNIFPIYILNVNGSLCSPHLTQSIETLSAPSYDKFNTSIEPVSFLTDIDTFTKDNSEMDKLEHGLRMQNDIDTAYDRWCKKVKHEMYDKLAFKKFTLILCTL